MESYLLSDAQKSIQIKVRTCDRGSRKERQGESVRVGVSVNVGDNGRAATTIAWR
jgi:hypothetical protein